MDTLPYIPYNSSNKPFAKQNRKAMTQAEQRMWFEILQHRPGGYKWIKQKMLDSFIVDFYCSKLLLAIEIDGDTHAGREDYDAMRSLKLKRLSVHVIRYTNDEVLRNTAGVYDDLMQQIAKRENKPLRPAGTSP